MEPLPEPPVDRPRKVRWCLELVAIPLGVILGIILLLSIFAQPHHGSRQASRITTAALQAGGIHKALILYAHDHEGRFPEGVTNSNEAYRKLFPDYLQEEKPFHVHGSAWHAAAPGHKPDNDIGAPPAYAQTLQAGENHWAYVSGLDQMSHGGLPLIADGFVEGSPGTYTDDPTKKGGVWKGAKAIVVFVSGSAKAMPLSSKSGFRVLQNQPATGAQVDVFHLPAPPAGSAGPRILNPE